MRKKLRRKIAEIVTNPDLTGAEVFAACESLGVSKEEAREVYVQYSDKFEKRLKKQLLAKYKSKAVGEG